MKISIIKILSALLLISLVLTSATPLYPVVVIKIGSIAPSRSPWDKALKDLGRQWEEISNGEVTIKIFPGGIAGTEQDMVRKMRIGLLNGAVLTNMGLTNVYPDIFALNIPLMITDIGELNYVMDKMRPFFEQEMEKKGFKLVLLTMAGWLHFFSKDPVNYPDDMKKHKLAFSTGEPEMEQAWKKSGFHIVPTELKDMLIALQSGMVNAFYLPAILAASGQYFPFTPNMCSQRISPLVGGIIIPEQTWKKIPEKYTEKMLAATKKLGNGLYDATVSLEKEAIDTMKTHGLKIVNPPADALGKWRETADKGMDQLIGKAFSKDIYDRIVNHLATYRKNKPTK